MDGQFRIIRPADFIKFVSHAFWLHDTTNKNITFFESQTQTSCGDEEKAIKPEGLLWNFEGKSGKIVSGKNNKQWFGGKDVCDMPYSY